MLSSLLTTCELRVRISLTLADALFSRASITFDDDRLDIRADAISLARPASGEGAAPRRELGSKHYGQPPAPRLFRAMRTCTLADGRYRDDAFIQREMIQARQRGAFSMSSRDKMRAPISPADISMTCSLYLMARFASFCLPAMMSL